MNEKRSQTFMFKLNLARQNYGVIVTKGGILTNKQHNFSENLK